MCRPPAQHGQVAGHFLSWCLGLSSVRTSHPARTGPDTHAHTPGTPPRAGAGHRPPPPAPSAPTHPTAACHHERRVVVAVLEATVSATADQRAHEWEEPAARRRVQRRAARVHLGIHVGAVLRAGARVSTAGGRGHGRGGGGWELGSRAGRSRPGRAALKQPARASEGRSQRREGFRVQSGRKGSAGQGPGRKAGSARLSRVQAWAVLRTGRIGRGPRTSAQPAG